MLRERSKGHNCFEEPWRGGLRPVSGLGSSSRAGDVSVLTDAQDGETKAREQPEAESRTSQENCRRICAFACRFPLSGGELREWTLFVQKGVSRMSPEWIAVVLAGATLIASIAVVGIVRLVLLSAQRSEQSGEERLEILREQQERLRLYREERQGLL